MKKLLVTFLLATVAFNAFNVVRAETNIVSATVSSSKSISAKAITDHECNVNEWHFVITQVEPDSNAPANITVYWGAIYEIVPLDEVTGKTAHYRTTSNLNIPVSSASAVIYTSWGGEFNLSHGPCFRTSPTPTISVSPTLTPTVSPTPKYEPSVSPTITPTPSIPQGGICDEGQEFNQNLNICINIECNGGGTCEVTNVSPTPTFTPTVIVTPTPTSTPSQGGTSNNNSSSSNSSSENKNEAASVAAYANTGALQETISNAMLSIGAAFTAISTALYGKKKKTNKK